LRTTQILIADDSPAVRKALRQFLEASHPWDVIEVEDGQAALSRALELRPSLVILDLAMPVMDGLSAAREISKALPGIPIVMYTMHWSPPLDLAAQKSGVTRLIPKVDSGALLSAIEELLAVQESDSSKPGPLPLAVAPPTAAAAPDPEIIEASEKSPASIPGADAEKKNTPEN
jgi:DNA-binding NarL/FixJ family response regulator